MFLIRTECSRPVRTGTARLKTTALLMLLSACTTAKPPPEPVPPPISLLGLERVLGKDARTLIQLFGDPDLDIREGNARKFQFAGPACVLDAYLYPPKLGGVPVTTYVEARTPTGLDFDRASCVAALARRPGAR